MNNQNPDRLENLEYLMDEIKELIQYQKDLSIERALLLEDFKLIKPAKEPNKLKLYNEYFKS